MKAQEETVLNDALCNSIAKFCSAEMGGSFSPQIPFIIRKSNLPLPVVLGGVYLALSSREKAAKYIERLNTEREHQVFKRGIIQKRIDECLHLFSDGPTLLSIAMIVANKVLVDRAYVNKTWAGILGVPVDEISTYEKTLLHVLEHNVEIGERALVRALDRIMEVGEGTRRDEKKKKGPFYKILKKIVACLSIW